MLIDGHEENKREIASVAEGPDLFILIRSLANDTCVCSACCLTRTQICISFVEKDETMPIGRTGFPRKREKKREHTKLKMSQNILTPDLLNPHHEPSQSEKKKLYWSALHNVGSRCK
ncbi:hypothetical protein GHT06_018034 [Daphnia sinensis]|uniref:Uncharacterized protein n=1 Tax=Daphnia sinensis TaxID=1820382 RepID=A0AAD5KMM5_9CRUS|nr:hypothetical protein GHT06_018034 [Daphnia sinensis]